MWASGTRSSAGAARATFSLRSSSPSRLEKDLPRVGERSSRLLSLRREELFIYSFVEARAHTGETYIGGCGSSAWREDPPLRPVVVLFPLLGSSYSPC